MANVVFNNLNEALRCLPYARVYQNPFDKENEFHIEVSDDKGGDYSALKELVELAKKNGFKMIDYYEDDDFLGIYYYIAKMKSDKKIECSFDQDEIYVIK